MFKLKHKPILNALNTQEFSTCQNGSSRNLYYFTSPQTDLSLNPNSTT